MKITIAHLFHDILNLYGESGNILALKSALESQDIEVEIKNLSIDNDNFDLSNVDFIYIGAGTEYNQKLALNALLKNKEKINECFLNNVYLLATGNSIELFGKSIETKEETLETLNIFDYVTIHGSKRIVSEAVFKHDKFKQEIIGFENHQGEINGIQNPLFTVIRGYGSNKESRVEGFKFNNFYGTYLLGPILARNPELLENICTELIKSKDINFEFKDFNFEIENLAHKKFLSKYTKQEM